MGRLLLCLDFLQAVHLSLLDSLLVRCSAATLIDSSDCLLPSFIYLPNTRQEAGRPIQKLQKLILISQARSKKRRCAR